MSPTLHKHHRNMFQKLCFLGIIFMFLPFKFDKNSNQIVTSKAVKFLNFVFIIISLVNFYFVAFDSFKKVFKNFENPESSKSAIYNLAYFVFTIYSYSFVCFNQTKIVKMLNKILTFHLILMENETDIKIFSRFLIFQYLLLQPFLFSLDIIFSTYDIYVDALKSIPYAFNYLFMFPTRLISICVCLILNFNSLLLEKCVKLKLKHSFYVVLEMKKSIFMLFNSYIHVFVFCQFIYIFSYSFGIFALILSFLLKSISLVDMIFWVAINLSLISLEILNLEMINKVFKNSKKTVSLDFESLNDFDFLIFEACRTYQSFGRRKKLRKL